eukprot:54694_1
MSGCTVIVSDHILYFQENKSLSSTLRKLNTEYYHSLTSKFNENASKLAYLIQNEISVEDDVEFHEITLPMISLNNRDSNTKSWIVSCLNRNGVIISIICHEYTSNDIKSQIKPLLNYIYQQFIQNFIEITNIPLYIMRIRCKSFIEPMLKKHCSYKWRNNLCFCSYSKTPINGEAEVIELEIINKRKNKQYVSFPTYTACIVRINDLYDTKYVSIIKSILNLSLNISKLQSECELDGVSEKRFAEIMEICNSIDRVQSEFQSVERNVCNNAKWKNLKQQFLQQYLRIKHVSIDIIEQCKHNVLHDKDKLSYYDNQLMDMLKLQKYENKQHSNSNYCNCYSCNQYRQNQYITDKNANMNARKIQCLNAIQQYTQIIHYFQNEDTLNTEQQTYFISLQQNVAALQQQLQSIHTAELLLAQQAQQTQVNSTMPYYLQQTQQLPQHQISNPYALLQQQTIGNTQLGVNSYSINNNISTTIQNPNITQQQFYNNNNNSANNNNNSSSCVGGNNTNINGTGSNNVSPRPIQEITTGTPHTTSSQAVMISGGGSSQNNSQNNSRRNSLSYSMHSVSQSHGNNYNSAA